MTPHRRRCLIKAILEVKGALSTTDASGKVHLLTAEKLILMSNADLLALYIELETAFDSANITEPHAAMLIEEVDTIIMEPVLSKPPKKD